MSERATLPGRERAVIKRVGPELIPTGDDEVRVDFNPSEISVEKGVTYAEQEIPGLDSPIQQFVHGEAEKLSVELFFDGYEDGEDVRGRTDEVNRLLVVDGIPHRPPIVAFVWGTISFTAVVERANTTFTMFLPDGTPVRARIDLTFREYTPPLKQLRAEPRHSADRTTVHQVVEGETLPAIAAAEYGRPTAWRRIAEANDVDDPRRLRPGDELVIPALEQP